ncbi:MAG: FlgD immunoglobulin-like domain containing protein, partial [Candidatus Eiseniibacteriota bacterium]
CPLGTGSIVVDPQFVGGTPFDYSLRFNSPCIDAADPAAEVPPGGNERADIGAREFASGPLITSVTLDPDDPTQDGLYTSGDEIVLVVRGEAREPDLPTTVEADFDDVENGAYNPSSIDVTPLETTLPAFGYRVSYTIVQAAPNLDGAERSITVTATTAVGGTTTEVFTVLIDGRAPPPPVLDRPTDTNVTSDTFLVTGSAAGADSVLVFLNEEDEIPVARVATDASERFGITITLVEGDNTISAVAKDLAGNASAPAQLGVTVRYVAAFAIEFPKRFSPGDTFSISTLEPAPTIEIAIYNLAGQLIRSLRGGGSEHVEIVWDGANERGERVNAGPYLARIMIRSGASGEERTEHRALVLMKGVSQP